MCIRALSHISSVSILGICVILVIQHRLLLGYISPDVFSLQMDWLLRHPIHLVNHLNVVSERTNYFMYAEPRRGGWHEAS